MQILSKDASIERILAETMSQAVWDIVYAGYISPPNVKDPYERRGDESGLSDIRNYFITDFFVKDGKVSIIFENLTEGTDSMKGKFIGDMIEYGIKDLWNNSNGAWSEPRPFSQETADRLNANPTELLGALKTALQARGFTVS
ncbi:MAG TPA: hypothetical protein VI423_10970 [Paenisporosarcina sp.]|nr:hypothetical protein [Paenisporosarcina sp.]